MPSIACRAAVEAGTFHTLAWVATVGAPLYVRRWGMSPYEVTSGWSVLGLGRTRSVEATELDRVELRSRSRMDGDTVYSLALVTRDGRDGLDIYNITEGEARWIGGFVLAVVKGKEWVDPRDPTP